MTLEGFVSIAEQATTGGAPIDAFQADENSLAFANGFALLW